MAEQWFNQLYLGDSIDTLKHLTAEGVRVDLAFADPPFNIGYSYDLYKDNLDDRAYLSWTERWLCAVHAILKPTGALWIAIGDEYVAELKGIAEKQGFYLRNWVVWYYTFGVHCTRKFSRSHTHLLYFVKDPKNFTFNDAGIRVRSARQMVYNDGRADPRGRVPDNTWILRRKTRREPLALTMTPGTSPAWPGRSRSARDSIVARCPSDCSSGSYDVAPTPRRWYSILSRAPAAP